MKEGRKKRCAESLERRHVEQMDAWINEVLSEYKRRQEEAERQSVDPTRPIPAGKYTAKIKKAVDYHDRVKVWWELTGNDNQAVDGAVVVQTLCLQAQEEIANFWKILNISGLSSVKELCDAETFSGVGVIEVGDMLIRRERQILEVKETGDQGGECDE